MIKWWLGRLYYYNDVNFHNVLFNSRDGPMDRQTNGHTLEEMRERTKTFIHVLLLQ